MSASTVTPKNKETIFERIITTFLKSGNDHKLSKFFALGKDWCKDEIHFNYLYLNLLCNFNCDINYYFEQHIKNSLTIECKSNLTKEDKISLFSKQYYDWIDDGNSGNFVEFLLEQIDISGGVDWQESNW